MVVGAGNSGCDIACDAGRNADAAYISVRRGYWFIPKHVFGKPADVFAEEGPTLPMWLEQFAFGKMLRLLNGDMTRLGLPKPDHKLFETHPILNTQLLHYLQHGDVIAKPGIETTEGNTVTFTDGTTVDVDLIMLATGYVHKVPFAQSLMGSEQHPRHVHDRLLAYPGRLRDWLRGDERGRVRADVAALRDDRGAHRRPHGAS